MPVASVGSTPAAIISLPGDVRSPRYEAAVHQTRIKFQPKEKPVVSSAAADLERLVFNRKLQFVVDHNSNQVIVKVIDKETDKVIKELPPEELQRLHRNLKENIGFLFDERV